MFRESVFFEAFMELLGEILSCMSFIESVAVLYPPTAYMSSENIPDELKNHEENLPILLPL
jgi:hypothetical protein